MEGTMAEIRMFAGNFAPRNWAYCQGQLMSIAQNNALFALLGTTYGGDGRTTFGLPDLRGRTMIGTGNGPGLSDRPLGQRSGAPTQSLNSLQLAAHTHGLSNDLAGTPALAASISYQVLDGDGTTDQIVDNYPAIYVNKSGSEDWSDAATATGTMAGVDLALAGNVVATGSVSLGLSGSSAQVGNQQPWLGMNYVICMFGIFPTRN